MTEWDEQQIRRLHEADRLRARARAIRPGSTLRYEYLQQACGLEPGHAYRAGSPGYEVCVRCTHVRQARPLTTP